MSIRAPEGFIQNRELTAFVDRIDRLKLETDQVDGQFMGSAAERAAFVFGMYVGINEFLEITETGEMTDVGGAILAEIEEKLRGH